VSSSVSLNNKKRLFGNFLAITQECWKKSHLVISNGSVEKGEREMDGLVPSLSYYNKFLTSTKKIQTLSSCLTEN
jgi:hypothetical protein